MPDPFEQLRTPTVPVEPDPAFARRLRRRVERAVTLPRGATVTDLDDRDGAAPRDDTPGVVPYLVVSDARRALDWYETVLGARRRGVPIVMPDGSIGHAELDLRGSPFYLADGTTERHVAPPAADTPASVSLVADVGSVDRAVDRALGAGALLERPAADYPHGRNAVIRDPFGHRWMLSSDAPEAAAPIGPGAVAYASLWVPDVERAASFFGAVLGWSFAPGSGSQGRQVEGASPHHGLWGGQPRGTLFCCFAVTDVAAAVDRVRTAGGTADAPSWEPYGLVAGCVDDQGTPFAVYQLPDEPAAVGATPASRPGDLAYVTLEVVASEAARRFYAAVLGWRFDEGRVGDGWMVDGQRIGLVGGQAQATGVPMYVVDDLAAAVGRVRAAGGTATDPTSEPYGLAATCVDDQGTRFGLIER